MEVKISEREKKCLQEMAVGGDGEDECYFYPFHYIAQKVGIETKQARRSIRALARKGLARYVRGLMGEEGVAGSGYGLTDKGFEIVDKMEKLESESNQEDLGI